MKPPTSRNSAAFLRARLVGHSGSVAVLVAVSLSVLLAFVSLAVEFGLLVHKQRRAESAADSAALAAVSALAAGDSTGFATEARGIAAVYGFADGADDAAVIVNRPPNAGAYQGNTSAVEVIVRQGQFLPLAALFYAGPYEVRGRAVALLGADSAFCVLALETSATSAVAGTSGTDVTLVDCGLAVNSGSDRAVNLQSGAILRATEVSIVGGYRLSGQSQLLSDEGILTGASPTADPYADLTVPSFSGCDHNSYRTPTNYTGSLNPGVYCNGIDIRSNARVTLNPGIYIVDRGNFSVTGGATATGVGVSIVLTSRTGNNYGITSFSNNSTVHLTAPSSGSTAGLILFQDRSAPTTSTNSLISGNQELNGAVYLPRQRLTFAGGNRPGQYCLQLVARTISFNGISVVNQDCAGVGVRGIGASAPGGLVE